MFGIYFQNTRRLEVDVGTAERRLWSDMKNPEWGESPPRDHSELNT